jgi:adenylate cyclase
VPATVLFADIRGYTCTTELLDLPHVARLLGRFYESCAAAVWEREGIINKLIGDAILAIFNFPITRADHVGRAVDAAIDLQKRCAGLASGIPLEERSKCPAGVGVGVATGEVSIGELGEFCKDFTAIGGAVNLASRLQAAAKPGEVLLTEEVHRAVGARFPGAAVRSLELKGFAAPVRAAVLGGADSK